MSSPIAVTALPMALTAAVFKGPDAERLGVISTLIGGRDLPLVEKDGIFRNDLELALTAIGRQGQGVLRRPQRR